MNPRASPEVTVEANSGQGQPVNGSNVQSSGVYVLPSNSIGVPTTAYKKRMKTSDKPGLPTGTLTSTRLVFNRLYREQMNGEVSSSEDYPVYPELANSVKDLIRSFLYQRMGLTPGERTFTSVKIEYADMLSQLKRRIEDKFPVLQAAQNSWLATEFIKEAMQRDKKAKVDAAKKAARKGSEPSVSGDNMNRSPAALSVGIGNSNGPGRVEVRRFEPNPLQQVEENEMGVQDFNREQQELGCAQGTSGGEPSGDGNRNNRNLYKEKVDQRRHPATSEDSHSEEVEEEGSEQSELSHSTVVQSRDVHHPKATKRTSPESSNQYQSSESGASEEEALPRMKVKQGGKRSVGRNRVSRKHKRVHRNAHLSDESDSIRPNPQKRRKGSKVARGNPSRSVAHGKVPKSSTFCPPRTQPSRRN